MEKNLNYKAIFVKNCAFYLDKILWGTAPGSVPFSKERKWEQNSLREWLKTPPFSAAKCEKIAALAADPEKTAEYKAAKSKGRAFQFAHDAAACAIADAKEKNAALTGVWIVDVDHIPPEELDGVKRAILALDSCFAAGVSVSRQGLAACLAYDTTADYSEESAAAIDSAARACVDAAIAGYGLTATQADAKAKNAVRWRFCLQNVTIKPDAEKITPLQVEKPEKAAKPADTQRSLALPQAVEELRKMPQDAPGKESEKRIEAALFACRDSKIPMNAAADAVRDALAASRPQSSRLKNSGVESLAAWVYDRPPKKKASPRDLAAEFWRGWRFDTFTGRLCSPDGERTTLDEAAALCVRTIGDISLNMARETAQAWVRHNPAAQFDGLTERAAKLAADYTPADAGAIERYAARCGFDSYETRRLRLWLYQVAARAFLRGEKTDGMLVLCSHAEGTGKTTFFNAISRAICGDDAAAVTFGRGDDDLKIKMCMRSVMVLDEIDKLYAKKDVAEIKALITETSSFVRVPYDTDPKVRLNSAVFGATTNAESPIPSGEGEARRYWVLKPKLPLFFEGEWEPLAMMREACFMVKVAIEKAADRYSAEGKIWVPSPEEERETAERNGGLKVDDASTLAIAAGIERLRGHLRAVWDKPQSLKSLAVVFEVGNGAEIGAYVQWDAPKARAAEIRRVIAARCNRQVKRYGGVLVSGYTLAELESEFCGVGTPSKTAAEFEFV